MKAVPIAAGGFVVVVQIPESREPPHRVRHPAQLALDHGLYARFPLGPPRWIRVRWANGSFGE